MIKKYFIYILILIYTVVFFGCSKRLQTPQDTDKMLLSKIEKKSKPLSKKVLKAKNIEKILKETSESLVKKDFSILSIDDNKTNLNIKDNLKTPSLDIAIVFPSQIIGKYAADATNAMMSYLIYKDSDFNLKVFDTINEDKKSIEDTFLEISNQGISKVMVLFTHNGAKYLTSIKDIESYEIYMPLIHKNDMDLNIKSVVYGSIDYSKQFNALLEYSNKKNIEFYDNSSLGNRLSKNLINENIKLEYQKKIGNDNREYNRFLNRKSKKLTNSSLIINMPIVKSSIILSQISVNDIDVYGILSTQVNYTPLLLSLTQVQDRKNMIVANSISHTNNTIEEYNSLLDNDINYKWVNYSTIIGTQYLVNKDISSFKSVSLENNQMQYPVKLFNTTKYAFKQIKNLKGFENGR